MIKLQKLLIILLLKFYLIDHASFQTIKEMLNFKGMGIFL